MSSTSCAARCHADRLIEVGSRTLHRHEPFGRMVGLERRDLRCEQHVIAAEGDGPVGVADSPHER
jgi:hypothetical protein